MQEGQTGFSAGAEIAAEAEMNSGKNAVKNVPAEILPAKADDLCAVRRAGVCEQSDNRLGDELNCDRGQNTEARGKHDGVPQRLDCPAGFPGTDILRAQR